MVNLLRRSAPVVACLLCILAVAACTPGTNPLAQHAAQGHDLPGFWLGLWHGIIIWVTFIWSLFDHSVSVYEVHNAGWAYDLGFTIGAALLHGGGVHAARRRRTAVVTVSAKDVAVKVEPATDAPM